MASTARIPLDPTDTTWAEIITGAASALVVCPGRAVRVHIGDTAPDESVDPEANFVLVKPGKTLTLPALDGSVYARPDGDYETDVIAVVLAEASA